MTPEKRTQLKKISFMEKESEETKFDSIKK